MASWRNVKIAHTGSIEAAESGARHLIMSTQHFLQACLVRGTTSIDLLFEKAAFPTRQAQPSKTPPPQQTRTSEWI